MEAKPADPFEAGDDGKKVGPSLTFADRPLQ